MKPSLLTTLVLLLFSITISRAQQPEEAEVRKMEETLVQAVLRADIEKVKELFSPDIAVHNPRHMITGRDQVLELMRSKKISYAAFNAIIEKVTVIDNIAMVMGKEVVVPRDEAPHAGKTLTRRFTNIWMKKEGAWKMIGRQATIIAIE